MSVQLGVLNEEAITEEDIWGRRHHHLTLAEADNSAPKWLNRVTNTGETETFPQNRSAVYPAAPRGIILLKCFVMAASALSRNPCVYPFGGLGGEGVMVFAFKMVPLLTETGSPDGAGMESGDNDCQPGERDIRYAGGVCECVCINRKADIWIAGSKIHTGLKEN